MIRTHDVVLVLDTNILPEIIGDQNASRIDRIFLEWVKTMCREISPPPKGKIVTIAASTDMINDYKTGLRRRRHSTVAKTLKTVFDRTFSRILETDGHGKVRLMLEMVTPRASASSRRVRDSYDQKFLDVVIYVAESKRWKDKKILFATRDQSLREDAEHALVFRKYKRVHIASDMDMFKDLFAC